MQIANDIVDARTFGLAAGGECFSFSAPGGGRDEPIIAFVRALAVRQANIDHINAGGSANDNQTRH